MAGSKLGGLRAAKTNRERHGDDFYQNIGAKGGKAETRTPKGFAADRDRASQAGRKGGLISRRTKNGQAVRAYNKKNRS